MNKSSAQDQTPGGFEGRAGGSKGNPTPTALHDSLFVLDALSKCTDEQVEALREFVALVNP
jgi:hypothetical protein